MGNFVVAGSAGFLLHDDWPWLHHHPADNSIASAPADSPTDAFPNASSNAAANAAAHNATPSAASKTNASASSAASSCGTNWTCGPLQLRCGNLVLLGRWQADLVLRPS